MSEILIIEVDPEVRLGREVWIYLVKQKAGGLCEKCGRTPPPRLLIAHHKNGNGRDHRLSNGQSLCQTCHTRHHLAGTSRDPDVVERAAAAQRGKPKSEAHRAAIRAAAQNREPVSEETKAKQRAAWKRRGYALTELQLTARQAAWDKIPPERRNERASKAWATRRANAQEGATAQ